MVRQPVLSPLKCLWGPVARDVFELSGKFEALTQRGDASEAELAFITRNISETPSLESISLFVLSAASGMPM